MERKEFTNLSESIKQVWLNEDHRKGDKVIVKGKMGVVVKQVGKDGTTENDEIYKVRFQDGSVANIPARDMEMQGGNPGENESEDITQINELKWLISNPLVRAAAIAGGGALLGLGMDIYQGVKAKVQNVTGKAKTGGGADGVRPGQNLFQPTPTQKSQTKKVEPKFGVATQRLRDKQRDRRSAVRDIQRSKAMTKKVRKVVKRKK